MTDEHDMSPDDTVQPDNTETSSLEDSQDSPTPLELLAQHFKVSRPVSQEGAQESRPEYALTVLGRTVAQFEDLASRYPFLNEEAGEQADLWARAIAEGRRMIPDDDRFVDTLGRDDSFWEQGVALDNGRLLSINRPKLHKNSNHLSGDSAQFHLSNYLKLGAQVTVPLWHSGIWLTLKAPSDRALLELQRRISMSKISLGHATSGMVFSNHSVYMMHHLVNFIMMHVMDTNVKLKNNGDLKDLILSTDLPSLYWGMASAMYSNGYPFKQPCTNAPDKCKEVYEATISLPRLQWVDREHLSTAQKNHMGRMTTKVDPDKIREYQNQHSRGGEKRVKVHDAGGGLFLDLKVPSIREYEDAGFQWVTDIEQMTDTAFENNLKGEERDNYMQAVAHTTSMRMYGHWIKQIVIGGDMGDDDVYIDDKESISQSLADVFSAHSDVSNNTLEAIGHYIDNASIAVIGIPKFHCPKCDHLVGGEDTRHDFILPIDMQMTFFILLGQRLAKRYTVN